MSQGLRKISKHSVIYGIGTVSRQITALVMLPIYTRYLSPADYGAIELLVMALELVRILIGLRITQAMFRYYILEDDPVIKRKVVSTVLVTSFAMSLIGSIAVYFSAEWVAVLLFGGSLYIHELEVIAFTLLTTTLLTACLTYLQANQEPYKYLVFSLISLVLQVSCNIYFVVSAEMHVMGVAYASLLSGGMMVVILLSYTIKKVGIDFSFEIWRRLVKFVAPLILASIGGFYASYSDKYFIRLFSGISAVGIYVLALRISSVIDTVYTTFNQSWSAIRFEIYKIEEKHNQYQQVFKILSAALALIGLGLVLFSKDLIFYMTDEAYHDATKLVPMLVLAVIIRQYVPFFNLGIMIAERTGYIARAAWYKAIVVTVLYLYFIPKYGALGAAASLCLANLFEAALVYYYSKGLFDMGLRMRSASVMLSVAAVMSLIGALMPPGGALPIIYRLLVVVAFMVVIFYLPIWDSSERLFIKRLVARLRSASGV